MNFSIATVGNCALVSFHATECRKTQPANRKSGVSPDDRADDLGYRVELCTPNEDGVEQLLALASTAGIGYSAFYGAAREYPDRQITLSYRGRILSTWK